MSETVNPKVNDAETPETEEQELARILAEADGSNSQETPEAEESKPPETPEEPKFDIDGTVLTKAEIKRMLENKLNETAWKQKLEEKGKRLNEAARLQERLEKDARFKEYIESFEDERLVELREQLPPEVADKFYKLEKENAELAVKVAEKEAVTALEQEEKKLMSEGATVQELSEAYKLVIEENRKRIPLKQGPMSLTEAMIKLASTGGLSGMIQRITEEAKKKAIEELKTNQKSNLPTRIGSNTVANTKKPTPVVKTDADDMEDFFNSNPLFAGVPKK